VTKKDFGRIVDHYQPNHIFERGTRVQCPMFEIQEIPSWHRGNLEVGDVLIMYPLTLFEGDIPRGGFKVLKDGSPMQGLGTKRDQRKGIAVVLFYSQIEFIGTMEATV